MYDPGWTALHSYPVEGDSAEYEVWRDGELFAVMWLDNLDLRASGPDRTMNATVLVNFYERGGVRGNDEIDRLQARSSARPFQVPYSEVESLLREGRDWLLENEQGRQPE